MNAAVLRAEIKSWERNFRSRHGRDPSVGDIKAEQDIAEKYKSYKKLLKESKANLSADCSALVPKNRAMSSADEPSSLNPFSPKKAKSSDGRGVESASHRSLLPDEPHTPTRRRVGSAPSLEVYSEEEGSEGGATQITPAANSGVSKARKRLRGEPVSASPNRSLKRYRSGVGDYNPITKKPNVPPNASFHDHSEESDGVETHFVCESPVKPSSKNGKHFKSLFEEEPGLKAPPRTNVKGGLSGQAHPKANGTIGKSGTVLQTAQNVVPMGESSDVVRGHATSFRRSDEDNLIRLSSQKRRNSAELSDAVGHAYPTDILIPPSPTYNGQVTAIPGKTSKKRRILSCVEEGADNLSTEEEMDGLAVVEVKPRCRLKSSTTEDSIAFDAPEDFDVSAIGDADEEAEIKISLPDDLRTVLHISPSYAREREERILVEYVLEGTQRVRRGEVWGIGEIEGASGTATDGEDDWVAEGTPWAAAEM